MPPSMVETISCPNCGQRMRVPADRGRLRVQCAGCRSPFEWSLPEAEFEVLGVPPPVPPQANPPPPSQPIRADTAPTSSRTGGLAWLLLALALPMGWALLLVALEVRPDGWTEFFSIVLLMLFGPVWATRGMARLTRWHWALALLPALLLYAAVLFAAAAWTRGSDGLRGVPGHFDTLDPDTTTTSELDRAMEDW